MKKSVNTIFVVALLSAAGFTSAAENAPSQRRQLYTVIDKIYTVEEGKQTDLYKNLSEKGVSTEDMNQPDAFVRSYTDTTMIFKKHAFLQYTYIPPAMRAGIELGTIIVTNRYLERNQHVANGVVPREHTSSYECIERQPGLFASISSCIEDREIANTAKQE